MEEMYWPGEGLRDNVKHGVWVLVHSNYAPRIKGWIEDPNKWGRFGGVILHGTKTKNETTQKLALISIYSAPHCSAFNKEIMKKLNSKSQNKPRAHLTTVLTTLLGKLKKDKHETIISGDFNAIWNPSSLTHRPTKPDPKRLEAQRNTRFWKNWVNSHELTNIKDTNLPGTPTFKRNNYTDDKDYVLTSPLTASATTNVGILTSNEEDRSYICSSLHAPICTEFNTNKILRTLPGDINFSFVKQYRPSLKATSPEKLKRKFKNAIWKASKLKNETHEINKLISNKPTAMSSTKEWDNFNRQRNDLEASCKQTVTDTEKKLNTRKKVESKLPTDTVAFTTSIIREQRFQIQQLIREITKKRKTTTQK